MAKSSHPAIKSKLVATKPMSRFAAATGATPLAIDPQAIEQSDFQMPRFSLPFGFTSNAKTDRFFDLKSDRSQYIRPPTGTSRSGLSKTTSPSSSGTPKTKISDINFPICRGGKFTTAITFRPGKVSGS